jgi:hypothetical protein
MDTVINLLIVQGILGGYDVLWNHEWKERLPSRPTAALEQKIHGVRELLYALIFFGLAWYAWKGLFAWMLAAILCVEIGLTAWDFVVEDQTRELGANERILHLILSITGGAYLAVLIPHWSVWVGSVSRLESVGYGFRSWILTVLALGVFAWGLRDLKSGFGSSRSPATGSAHKAGSMIQPTGGI